MGALGFAINKHTYHKLITAYLEPHRAYHTLDHIKACLRHLDDTRSLATNPASIELALWFHDAIYKPYSKTNEEDSAVWAKTFLEEQGAPEKLTDDVYSLIMMTQDHIAAEAPDAQLMLDIDLSILGTPESVYNHFEKGVRYEYKRIPLFLYRKKRKKILQSFIDRPRIYRTDYFYKKFENQARENLGKAIDNL